MQGADALISALESWIHAIQTKYEEAQKHTTHQMIQIANSWMIWKLLERKLSNLKPLILFAKENVHVIDRAKSEVK